MPSVASPFMLRTRKYHHADTHHKVHAAHFPPHSRSSPSLIPPQQSGMELHGASAEMKSDEAPPTHPTKISLAIIAIKRTSGRFLLGEANGEASAPPQQNGKRKQ